MDKESLKCAKVSLQDALDTLVSAEAWWEEDQEHSLWLLTAATTATSSAIQWIAWATRKGIEEHGKGNRRVE